MQDGLAFFTNPTTCPFYHADFTNFTIFILHPIRYEINVIYFEEYIENFYKLW